MPAATVLDWSGWRPTDAQLAQMKTLGIVGCQRYESDDAPGNQWKVCSKTEYDRILGAGLSILAGFEVSKTSWQQGRPLGLIHGEMARRKWRLKGHPDTRPIAFAVDSDVPNNAGAVDTACAYLRGCLDGGGGLPISSYGETSVIDAAVNRGITVNAWRAAAVGWDSTPSKHASLEQKVTKSYPQFPPDAQGNWPYDENIIIKPDWGQHPAPTGVEVANPPYSLIKDETGKIWQVSADQQSKIMVPDNDVLGWVTALLIWGGYTADQAKVGEVGTNLMLRRWLANIPDANKIITVPPPVVNVPPVDPAPIAAATGVVVKSLLNQQQIKVT